MPTIHQPGARCFARIIQGDTRRWLEAVVVQADPLEVEVVSPHPIWRGARLSKSDAHIRVHRNRWPKESERYGN